MSFPMLLECTLRDGSYAIDFQFTSEDTTRISRALDLLGFPYIEVGHGVGIGASDVGTPAAASDIEYARATNEAVSQGKWGMFAIHGIATAHQIRSLKDEGMAFVRVGVEAGDIVDAMPLIEAARDAGLEVFINIMKSYTQHPQTLGFLVRDVEMMGVSGIYLVDSAGGMLPADIAAYAHEMLEARTSTLLGFHGHENLGLAVANSISVAERGFDLVDSTLQGLGRSAGNASTERLVSALARLGSRSYDVAAVSQAGETLVRPRIPRAGFSGLDTFAGFTRFHSSYLPILLEVARRRRVDPYVLMEEHCKVDQLNATKEQMDELANSLKDLGNEYKQALPLDTYAAGDQ
jgi:4-hydroxy 2-oxovalerate aldolase